MSAAEQLQAQWLIFLWALSIGLLTLGIAWRRGLFQAFRVSRLPVIKGRDVLRGFGYFLVAELLLFPFLFGLFFAVSNQNGKTFDEHTKTWFNLLMVLGGACALVLAYFKLHPSQRRELWKQTSTPWTDHVVIGIGSWCVCYPLVLASSQLLSIGLKTFFNYSSSEQSAVKNLRLAQESDPWVFILTSVTVITCVPLMEEFLFRGLLQSWLKQKFHRTSLAIILSSVIFALFHYSSNQGLTNIELLSSLFLLSCMLGYIYERQRSLWAPVSLHAFFNFISLLFITSTE